MTFELQAKPHEVMRAVEALQAYGTEQGVAALTLFGLTLALEECASNIVHHALAGDAGRTFHVAFEITGGEMVIELRDDGPPFDPTMAPAREPSPDDEDLPPGGWGIQLVRNYTDSIHYERTANQNVLRLTKRTAPA